MTIQTIFWTLANFREKIERDLDLSFNDLLDENFITKPEFAGLVNEAIDKAEQLVHTLYEDYFLTRETMALTSGTEEYAIPLSIYANKIRRVIYRNGSRVYTIQRIRDWKKFEEYELSKSSSNASSDYVYFVVNTVPGFPKMLFMPTPVETGSFVQLWFIRGANRLELDTDICDIPEAQNYILAYLRMKVFEKEMNPMLDKAISDLQNETTLLETTLAAMVPDTGNEIEADYSHYREHN